MIINENNCKNLRNHFCDAVFKVFDNSTTFFLDFLEDEKYSSRYDCFLDPSGENYIINRETGEYINWYKLYHLGRCINISVLSNHKNFSKWFEKFLVDFKERGDNNE